MVAMFFCPGVLTQLFFPPHSQCRGNCNCDLPLSTPPSPSACSSTSPGGGSGGGHHASTSARLGRHPNDDEDKDSGNGSVVEFPAGGSDGASSSSSSIREADEASVDPGLLKMETVVVVGGVGKMEEGREEETAC